jgi:leucyl-tRNA synthetase
VQVNGKVRGRIKVARDADEETVRTKALEEVANQVRAKTVLKTLVVPGRLVSVVVK